MKIKASKLFALLLAVVLVFGSIAVAASAANENPYVKVSSVINAEVGAKAQEFTVALSPDTELKNAKLVLTADLSKVAEMKFEANKDVSGLSVKSSQTNNNKTGVLTIEVPAAANTSTTDDLVLVTVTIDFKANATGAVELSYEASKVVDADPATIAGLEWGAGKVEGVEGEVYNNLVGIGLKGAIKTSSKSAPEVDAKATLTVKALDGKEYTVEIDVTGAYHGNKVMTKDDFAKYLDTNKTSVIKKIQTAMGNTELTYDEFDLDVDSVKLNGAAIKATEKYDEKAGEYEYTADMVQCEPTTATIKVVFRSAMSEDLYHGSDIPDYSIKMTVHAGKTVANQATILTYIKKHVDLYTQLNGETEGILIDGYKNINDHIVEASAGKYDLGDFVLDESVVAFNNAKISGSEKYSANSEQNVFTVYFDQVNVPESVLMAAADAFGKLDYGQFADAYVLTINEAIGAFEAFCDSLVNAEWPSAEDVEEEEDKDSSDSPKTGAVVGLGAVVLVSVALGASAVAIVRKKED